MKKTLFALTLALALALAATEVSAANPPPDRMTVSLLVEACDSDRPRDQDGCFGYIAGVIQATHLWRNLSGVDTACHEGSHLEEWLRAGEALVPHLREAEPTLGDADAVRVIALLYLQHYGCEEKVWL